ncbi:MAG: four helix bundle protein [Alphaproteobacteria bacterium]|nr:four helix bundle protein [Alphaproteobacteria bacterium]
MAPFPHETLDCYRLSVEVGRAVRGLKFPRGEADLKAQAVRAGNSVVLNIAEGCSKADGSRLNHFRIARGSAAELAAVLDLLDPPSRESLQMKLRRIGWMLVKLR